MISLFPGAQQTYPPNMFMTSPMTQQQEQEDLQESDQDLLDQIDQTLNGGNDEEIVTENQEDLEPQNNLEQFEEGESCRKVIVTSPESPGVEGKI